MIRTEIVEGMTVDGWDDLADRIGANPYQMAPWFRFWVEAFGGEPLAVAAYDGVDLVGVLPLVMRRKVLSTPTNGHSYLFGSLADGGDAANSLASRLIDMRSSRASLVLPENDPVAGALGGSAWPSALVVTDEHPLSAPYVMTSESWDAYEAQLPTRRKSEIRRRERRLAEEGSPTLTVEGHAELLDARLSEFLTVEASGWKGAEGTSISSDPRTRDFYSRVARWSSDRGWLRLVNLRLDGRPIASDFSIEHAGVHYLMKTGYDPEFRRFGPGLLLRYRILKACFESDVSRYEFLGTTEGRRNDWKHEWTERFATFDHIEIHSQSVMGRLGRGTRAAATVVRDKSQTAARQILSPEVVSSARRWAAGIRGRGK